MMRKELRALAYKWYGGKSTSITEGQIIANFLSTKEDNMKSEKRTKTALYWATLEGSIFEVEHITNEYNMWNLDGTPILECLRYRKIEDMDNELSVSIARACHGAAFFECDLYIIAVENHFHNCMEVDFSFMRMGHQTEYYRTDFS